MKREKVYEKLEKLVLKGIETGRYTYINKAFEIATEEEIAMYEDEEYVIIEDEVYYFNGAF